MRSPTGASSATDDDPAGLEGMRPATQARSGAPRRFTSSTTAPGPTPRRVAGSGPGGGSGATARGAKPAAVYRVRRRRRDVALADVGDDARGIALERVAEATAAARFHQQDVAGLEGKAADLPGKR